MYIPRASRFAALLLAFALLSLAACTRDPNVRKQRYLESGRKYYSEGKYREAAIQFQNAIQIDGRFADAHYELAKAYIKLESWSNGYRELSRTVDLQPDNTAAQLDLGNMMLAGGAAPQAQAKAELLLGKDPNNPDAHALLANVHAAKNEPGKAIEEIDKAIQLDGRRSNFYLNRAVLEGNARQLDKAEGDYRKAIELDPNSVSAVEALANFYERQQKWPEAEQQLKRASLLAPKRVPPRLELARLYLGTNRRDDAERVLRETKLALPDVPGGYRLLADFYLAQGEYDRAVQEFKALLAEHPQDDGVRRVYARVLLSHGDVDGAERITNEVLKANPRDPDGQIIRAQIQVAAAAIASGNLDQVMLSAEQLINALPFSADGYLFRARGEILRRQFGPAEADLQHAIQLAPRDPVPYTHLAELRDGQQKTAEADALVQKALEVRPGFVEAINVVMARYERQKQPAKALSFVESQIVLNPKSSPLYLIKANILGVQKDWEGAEVAAQKAVEVDPTNVGTLVALAQIQAERKEMDKAVATFESALRAQPNDLRLLLLAGAVQDSKGDYQRATELYQRALKLQPDNALAANNLAFDMLEHGGNVDVALSLAQTARSGMPNIPTTADTLAWAYYKKGVYRSAVDLLEAAVKQAPDNASIHYHLGMAYQKLNNAANAKAHLDRALKLDPNNPHAQEIRAALGSRS